MAIAFLYFKLSDLMVQRFGIKKGDSLKFVLYQIINYGEATDI